MNPLGIEQLTLLGMPPVEYIKLAGSLGCAEVSIGLTSLPLSMFGLPDVLWPDWSLRDDAALRREMKAAMADTGVCVGLAEGFRASAAEDPRDCAGDLDRMAELGALRVNAICMEDDMAKDKLGTIAEMSATRGMDFTIEFFPSDGINCLERVLDVVNHIGHLPNGRRARVLFDTMHFFRTGGTMEQFKALDPDLIGYCQLADSVWAPPHDNYFMDAMFAREVPGTGALPLREFVHALPEQITVSLEVPRLDDLRNMKPEDHAARCVAAARALWE
jgi:sugar phosphate isomerase/epimerase